MAKSTKTFSLEGDIIDKIVEYKERKGLSSDSAALERIILEFSYRVDNYNNNKLDNIEGLLTELFTRIDTKNKTDFKEVIRSVDNEEIINIDLDINKPNNELKCPQCSNEIEVECLLSGPECYYCFCNVCDFEYKVSDRKDSSKVITQSELEIFYINKMSGAINIR